MRQIMNVAGFSITVIVNAVANIVKFNGKTTAEVSEAIPTPFAPAGCVFVIWGLIHALLAVFAARAWKSCVCISPSVCTQDGLPLLLPRTWPPS